MPRLTLGTLAAAGAVAGLAGAVIVMSQPFRFIDDALTAPGYTFAGVAAALLAGGRPALLPLTAALFTILSVDPFSGTTRTILASAAVTGTGDTFLRVSPSIAASANAVAQDVIPAFFTITAVHGDADSITYSVAYQAV